MSIRSGIYREKRRRIEDINSGYQNQYISIMSEDGTDNESGGVEPNYITYWETTAKVRSLRATRNTQANQSILGNSWEFTVRYRDDKNIDNGMIVKWRGNELIIQGYVPDLAYQEFVIFNASQSNSGQMVIGGTT